MTGYTTSTALLEAMAEAGISCAFANLGSDHTGIMETYARASGEGRLALGKQTQQVRSADGRPQNALPELILCPHEHVALSAAHGYAQVSGVPQAVIVHTDCGTQNLGGAVHNAARGRVPVLIFAGLRRPPRRASCPAPGASTFTGCKTPQTSAVCSAATSSTTTRSAPAAT